jgi:hypothetical protein
MALACLFTSLWKGTPEKKMPLVQNDAPDNGDRWSAVNCAPLFTGVSPEDFRRISTSARLQRLKRSEMVYLEGDTVQQVLLLVSGSIKLRNWDQRAWR